MENTSTTAATAHRRINPSPPTSLGPISSARSDQNELIAQARQVLALKQELISRERQLLNACRRAEIPLEELYGHALR
jgi:hypothetical protein